MGAQGMGAQGMLRRRLFTGDNLHRVRNTVIQMFLHPVRPTWAGLGQHVRCFNRQACSCLRLPTLRIASHRSDAPSGSVAAD